ncbi:Uncharacterised protein [Xylophilus ampelinus]|nr:hypothetical protein [Variovorax sp.]VTY40242.1 Uncharacterised protein [Xylophilus ampelinus]|tara:strand:- start:143 stop:445 length:303 start_codon:yes stop_codon:yes gene_type:complete
MPLELLHALARAPLPLRITDPADIDKLRALQAAGQVRAQIPPARQGLGGQEEQPPAVVFEITRLGRMAVQTFRPPTYDPAAWAPGMPLPTAQPSFQASLR